MIRGNVKDRQHGRNSDGDDESEGRMAAMISKYAFMEMQP
jgi:hypothetical protein